MALLARSQLVARTTRPGLSRPAVAPLPRRVAVSAYKNEGLDSEDINEKAKEALDFVQKKWEQTEDKPAAVAVTGGALLLLITASSVVDTIDKIPIISGLIELVGIGVTAWFTWRYLLFGPDREELVSNIKGFIKKVYGA